MEGYKWWAEKLREFLKQYKWLLDAYVIEFFTESHWSKLPVLWQETLRSMEIALVSRFLLTSPFHRHRKSTSAGKVYPLSLLAFVATAHALSVPRHPRRQREECREERRAAEKGGGSRGERRMPAQVAGLGHVFRRHVKPKKQHEIRNLAEEAMRLVEVTGCRNFIDVGSGQGHLARYLAYHCGLDVVTVDAIGCHLTAAAKFDSEVERDLERKAWKPKAHRPSDHSGVGSIAHVESVIQPDVSLEELLSQLGLCTPLPDESLRPLHQTEPHPRAADPHPCAADPHFILVGLHTCGDLAATILRVYAQSRQVVGLLSVGCCYMKLSCLEDGVGCSQNTGLKRPSGIGTGREWGTSEQDVLYDGPEASALREQTLGSETIKKQTLEFDTDTACSSTGLVWGYPMSKCLAELPVSHTRLSYEAREVACHSVETYRERLVDNSHHVRVHCHRAVVETILRKHGMRRSQVKISKRISKLPFTQYATAVLGGLGIPLSELETCGERLAALLCEWRAVAVFFMLRLVLAPCVESALLLDRLLFLREQGLKAELTAVFDPNISPRNLLITSHKS